MHVNTLLTSCSLFADENQLVLAGIIVGVPLAIIYCLAWNSTNRSSKEKTLKNLPLVFLAAAEIDLENPSDLGLPHSCNPSFFSGPNLVASGILALLIFLLIVSVFRTYKVFKTTSNLKQRLLLSMTSAVLIPVCFAAWAFVFIG